MRTTPMNRTPALAACIAAAILLACQTASAQTTRPTTLAAAARPYGAQAREVQAYVQQTFWDANRGVYVKTPKERTPDYVWREGAACSALVAAVRHEPKTYRPVLAKFFQSLDAYWDAKAPIPAYEPA